MRGENGLADLGTAWFVCTRVLIHAHTYTHTVHIHILRHMHTKVRILEKANKRCMPYAVEMEERVVLHLRRADNLAWWFRTAAGQWGLAQAASGPFLPSYAVSPVLSGHCFIESS